jgi:hypothetical protein
MRIRLYRLNREPTSKPIVLDQLPAVLGSSPQADVSLPQADLAAFHCEFSLIEGDLWVRDLDTQSGTFVCETSVLRAPVMPGDRLSLGEARFMASYERVSSRRPADPVCRIDWATGSAKTVS